MAFAVSWSDTTATIAAGTIRLHGIGNYLVDGDTVSLSGSTAWVYVYHEKNHSDSGFGVLSTEPNSNGTQYRFPLVKLDLEDGAYVRNDPICHEGDINALAPLR
jgi:hypothetical protein